MKVLDRLISKVAPLRRLQVAVQRRRLVSYEFWANRYREGGNSGPGSYGRLAAFKAEVVNEFIEEHAVTSAIELGCGDGNQLGLIKYPSYIGVDVSPAAISHCQELYGDDRTKRFLVCPPLGEVNLPRAQLAVSLDVIFHLIEDAVFDTYMRRLFGVAEAYVIIYSSDASDPSPWPSLQNRKFTNWVSSYAGEWTLVKRVPNRYPWDSARPQPLETSLSHFVFYERRSNPSGRASDSDS